MVRRLRWSTLGVAILAIAASASQAEAQQPRSSRKTTSQSRSIRRTSNETPARSVVKSKAPRKIDGPIEGPIEYVDEDGNPTTGPVDTQYEGTEYGDPGYEGDGYVDGGDEGWVEPGYPYANLFHNYWVGGTGATAAMYVSPLPTPPLVGHTYVTYPPFRPHNYLYQHSRSYLTPNPCGGNVCTEIDYGYCPRKECCWKNWKMRP